MGELTDRLKLAGQQRYKTRCPICALPAKVQMEIREAYEQGKQTGQWAAHSICRELEAMKVVRVHDTTLKSHMRQEHDKELRDDATKSQPATAPRFSPEERAAITAARRVVRRR